LAQAELSAKAIVPRWTVSLFYPLIDLFSGALTVVGASSFDKLLSTEVVTLSPLGLEYGSLIEIDLKPGKCFDDSVSPLRSVSRLVGIIDPQKEAASLRTCIEPVVQSGASTTDVKIPSWRRSKPQSRM
jgi:hypothetical protein